MPGKLRVEFDVGPCMPIAAPLQKDPNHQFKLQTCRVLFKGFVIAPSEPGSATVLSYTGDDSQQATGIIDAGFVITANTTGKTVCFKDAGTPIIKTHDYCGKLLETPSYDYILIKVAATPTVGATTYKASSHELLVWMG